MAELSGFWKSLKPGDAVIAALMLAAALLPLLWLFSKDGARMVEISVAGEVVYYAPVGRDAVVRAGESNVVSIAGGVATMIAADCPDRLCMRLSAGLPGESVVCLPARVTVRILGAKGPDDVAY